MDYTRKADLEELYGLKKAISSPQEKDKLDKIAYDIKQTSKNKKIVELRRRLAMATRHGKGADARILSERIKQVERQSL